MKRITDIAIVMIMMVYLLNVFCIVTLYHFNRISSFPLLRKRQVKFRTSSVKISKQYDPE